MSGDYRKSILRSLQTKKSYLRQKRMQIGRLGNYYRVNPIVQKYVPNPQVTMDLITPYRTGSHSLPIELGRYSNVTRENRYCICGNNVQTVWHIFMQCPFTNSLNNKNDQSLDEIFADESTHVMLLPITKKLKIPI